MTRALGPGVRRERTWANQNARFVVLERDGVRWILKVLLFKPAETLDAEFEGLTRMHARAKNGPYVVPTPIHLWAHGGAYLASFEQGVRVSDLLVRGPAHDADAAVAQAGVALASLHRAQAEGTHHLVPGRRALLTDPAWRSHVPRWGDALVAEALVRCAAPDFTFVDAHLDYDPVNLLRDGPRLIILDPPSTRVVEVIHWDLAVFMTGIRRSYWRRLAGLGAESPAASALVDRFLTAYLEAAELAWRPVDRVLLHFSEVVRLAQLRRWWSGPARDQKRLRWAARRLIGRVRLSWAIDDRLRALADALAVEEVRA
jgi:hypothetical protein